MRTFQMHSRRERRIETAPGHIEERHLSLFCDTNIEPNQNEYRALSAGHRRVFTLVGQQPSPETASWLLAEM